MKRALIATLYNEADNVRRWWDCILKQDTQPDEIVIVDGGSKDGTWELLQELAQQSSVHVSLKQQRCNIAEGRNLAIKMTDAKVIASTDAGSFPETAWFGEITRALLENPDWDFVGGKNVNLIENEFQKFIEEVEGKYCEPKEGDAHGSGRNTAFHRSAWEDVGGYPEWLTLTGEDLLFNLELQTAGKRIGYAPAAMVKWPVRETANLYYRMLYQYGFGAGEAHISRSYFLRRMCIMLFPPLIVLSRHRFKFLKFRYLKNAYSAAGWLLGLFKGNPPPSNWRRINGVYMSPQAQKCYGRKL